MISAIPITIGRLDPSGSLMNQNNDLEHARAVMPRITSEVFFDMRYIIMIQRIFYILCTLSHVRANVSGADIRV
jgi:hypothetical protein